MSWKQIRGEHNRNYNVDNTFTYDENLDVHLVSGEVTCGDGNIVFAGGRTAIYCYNTTEYELNLVWQNDNVIGDVISVMPDDILVRYVDGGVYPPITHLYALSKIDGSITWEQTFTGFFESLFYAPEVNSIIFTKERSLGALSVATGEELWNADYSFYGLDYNDINNQTIRGNNVFPRTISGTIHAFSLTDGSKVWEAYPEDDLSKSFFNCYIFAQDDNSFYAQCEEIGTGLYYILRYSFNGQYLSSFSHTHSFHRVASVGSIVYCDTVTAPSPGTAVYKIDDGVFSALVPSSEDSSFTISIAANNDYIFRTVYDATLGYKCEIIDLSGNVLNLGAYGGTIVLPDGDKIFIYDGSTRVIQKYEITILGVEDGVVYAEPVTPVVNIVNAETSTITFYKNGIETDFLSGTTIDKNGIYSLNVLAQNGDLIALASVTFQIAIAPKITVLGVEDDMVYSEMDLPLTPDAIITDAEEYSVTLLKDGLADPEFRLGDNLWYSWNYVLIISAINAPLQTTVVVNFTIDVQPTVDITGVTNGAAYIKEPVKPKAVITNAENSDYTLIKYDKEVTRYRLGRDTLAQTGDYFLTVTAINGHNEASDSVAFSLYMDDYSLPEIPGVTEDPGDPIVITDPLVKAFRNVHHFKNYQFLDTGYRKHNPEYKKRYRECQFRLNNVSQKQQHFYTAFLIDGDRRRSFMKYNLQHNIDPDDPEYGLITMVPEWVDPTIVPGVTVLGKETSDVNAWQLDVSTFPDRSLWKVRIPVSGKGYAPRLQLLSKSEQAYELLSITWVARMLNSR